MNIDLSACRHKAPGHHLAVLHRLSSAFLAPRMRITGIKRGWIGVLLEVLDHPGQPQDALCKSLKVDPAAAARTLFELEDQGYVTRREDERDRRQKLVFPTPKTLALAEDLFTVLKAHNQALFHGFDAARRETALDILTAMAANLENALRGNTP